MKIIQYYNNKNVLEETVIHKMTLIEKIKFILTGRINILYPLLKAEDIRMERSKRIQE